MTRRTANGFSPDLLELSEPDVHGSISMREFRDRAAKFIMAA